MKICWISSWPPRSCGIATYSFELVEALRNEGSDIHVVCHKDGGYPGEENVYPVIDLKRVRWDQDLYSVVKKIGPDILHIQHEYGLYSVADDYSAGLFRPLFRWRFQDEFPIVITYHSVYAKLDKTKAMFMDLVQRLVDAGIVHEYYQWVNLPVNIGRIVDNVYVIPHGARADISISKQDAKKFLGLEGKKIIGMLGWFTPTKGYDRVIKMWDSISSKLGPDTYLVLAGEVRRNDPSHKKYREKLLQLVEKCKAKDKIKVVLRSISAKEYERILAAFDIMVLPYTFISQSGNLAHSFAFGVPVVASSLEGLKAEVEASGAGVLVPYGEDDELERAILTLAKDDTLREKCSRKALDYVRNKISWSIVAKKHMRLYRKLLEGKKTKIKDLRSEIMLE